MSCSLLYFAQASMCVLCGSCGSYETCGAQKNKLGNFDVFSREKESCC